MNIFVTGTDDFVEYIVPMLGKQGTSRYSP